jgi:hypothetical protein
LEVEDKHQVTSTKGEAPIFKHQIPNNIQTPISNDLNKNNLNFIHWNLFEIWKLKFGAYLVFGICDLEFE